MALIDQREGRVFGMIRPARSARCLAAPRMPPEGSRFFLRPFRWILVRYRSVGGHSLGGDLGEGQAVGGE
ncbi:hypothetical protein PB2503_04842 [Parvularcula bermudensis HTCC2503]|uniref:Uncharacterized protein n=1 Tax=Parvularcula bermudensis (strain ATCC BAA-594 / HTCC2503 / KCTC 12087) TaxID=314260 RepID=E0TFC5_PARBH|nr:hypothetical protein PB2503_04842 [Parvularcula bermudensis HTCC2503]